MEPFTKPACDDELLEPLPVVVDGVSVAPEWADHSRALADVVPHAFEVIDSVCTRIVDTPGLAGLSPWLGPQSLGAETRAPIAPTTFSRIFELRAAQLESLPEWWRRHSCNERVVIARRLSLRAPRLTDTGVWSMPAALRDPLHVKPIRMELSLWRHLGGWTKLVLEPTRRVHRKTLYFEAGHRVLDALCNCLLHELATAPVR